MNAEKDKVQLKLDEVVLGREVKKGRCNRFVSIRGGLSAAARMAVSHLSASRPGIAVQVDLHRTSVTRWEVKLAACVTARARSFFEVEQAKMMRPLQRDAAGNVAKPVNSEAIWFAVTSIRSDATNSECFQISKLCVT